MIEALPWIALTLNVVSLIIAVFAFSRAGRWRDTDSAKALIDRISGTETRCTTLEAQMSTVATKADVAALVSDVKAVERQAVQIERGVERIEGFLMGHEK